MSDKQESRSPDEIEAEIRQTRENLDDTLHELEDRLSPKQFMDSAYNHVRNGGANEFFANLGNAIKQNPMPVLLIGIGVGWLMLSDSKSGQKGSSMLSSKLPQGMPGRHRTPGRVTEPATAASSAAPGREDDMTGANRPVSTTRAGSVSSAPETGTGKAGSVGEATHLGTSQHSSSGHSSGNARPARNPGVGEATHLGTQQERANDAGTSINDRRDAQGDKR